MKQSTHVCRHLFCRISSVLLTAIAASVLPAAAQTGTEQAVALQDGIRLIPDPVFLSFRDTAFGNLATEDLAIMALRASGMDTARLGSGAGALMDILETSPPSAGNIRDHAELLLEWMHENHLTRYVENQTRLDTLMQNGTYNCVSSAVFYLLLTHFHGIPVEGVLTTDHAFCRVNTGSGMDNGVDVETTTAYGFNPEERREAVDSFTGRTGFIYVPPGNYSQRQAIPPLELMSLILQNRIAELQRRSRWEETVGLALDRWTIAGNTRAKSDFILSLNNYAAEADRRGTRLQALRRLLPAAEVLGDTSPLADSATALLGNQVSQLARASRFSEALELLNTPDLTALVPQSFLDNRRRELRRADIETLIRNAAFPDAVLLLDEALADTLIAAPHWEELSLYVWSKEAGRVSSGNNWLLGWQLLQTAPASLRSSSRWPRLEGSYRSNAGVTFHNRFVDAFRLKDWTLARSILDEGISLFPDNRILLQDLTLLENQQNR